MDSERFDRFARTWGAGSRRRVLAGLAAAALASLSPGRVGAACNPATCRGTFDCGERSCGPEECEITFSDAGKLCREAAGECDLAEVCTGEALACPADRKRPNGSVCSDDGDVCTDDICQNGECVHPAKPDGAACPAGACCAGRCTNLKSDKRHCGQCGKRCTKGNCRNGRCKRRKKKR